MEFKINVYNSPQGDITILDLSKEYNQYLDENDEALSTYKDSLFFKYSSSVTVNVLMQIGTKEITFIDAIIHEHKKVDDVFEDDQCTYTLKKDGYYVIDHFIFPTIDWYNWYKTQASEEYKNWINRIYIIDEGVIKKEVDGELVETTLREVLEMNIENASIARETINTIFTGNLQQCYINYCKRLFDSLLNKCLSSEYSNDIYARDFIWMTLNIIDYLVQFEQYMEAERIIEEFSSCGGFCNSSQFTPKHHGCGCSKA